MRWSFLWNSVLDLVFPRACLGCGRSKTFLCEGCRQGLPVLLTSRCPGCERADPTARVCADCRSRWTIDALWVAAPYLKGGLLQNAIQTLKYHHTESLAHELGLWMAKTPLIQSLFEEVPGFTGIIPVPLHADRHRERGYNQAERLAQAFSAVWRVPQMNGLTRVRATFPQAQCSRPQRLVNVSGAFAVTPGAEAAFLGGRFLLVDDVCSTGSTLNACAEVLKQGGATEVVGLVLARGILRP